MKTLQTYIIVTLLFSSHILKSQEINVLLDNITLLEYVSDGINLQSRYIIRAKNQNLWFDFWVKNIDSCSSVNKQIEFIKIESYLESIPNISSIIYVCFYKDDKIMRVRCYNPNIYKIIENQVYLFDYKNNWLLDADFNLRVILNKKCCEDEIKFENANGSINLFKKEELILKKISYSKSNQRIFDFVKCSPECIGSFRYKYMKDFGRVEFEDIDSGTIWRLYKIDEVIFDI